MAGSLAFLLLALLACMALALGVIAFFAFDAVRDGRRFLNQSGERIVSQAVESSSTVLGKGRERLGTLVGKGATAQPVGGRAVVTAEDDSSTEALGDAIRKGRDQAAKRPTWG